MMRYSILLLSATAIGCMKPYKKVSPGYDAGTNYSGVLVNATVDATGLLSSGEDDSMVKGAVEAAMVLDALEPFSNEALELAFPYWKQEGFTVVLDEARVSDNMPKGLDEFSKIVNTVSGIWVHPQTAKRYRVANNTILLRGTRERMVAPLNTEVENEAFVFTYVSFSKRQKFFVQHYPVVVFDTIILGEQGEYLYRSRGVGNGDPRLLLIDMSQKNLTAGFNNALKSLETAETTIVDK